MLHEKFYRRISSIKASAKAKILNVKVCFEFGAPQQLFTSPKIALSIPPHMAPRQDDPMSAKLAKIQGPNSTNHLKENLPFGPILRSFSSSLSSPPPRVSAVISSSLTKKKTIKKILPKSGSLFLLQRTAASPSLLSFSCPVAT